MQSILEVMVACAGSSVTRNAKETLVIMSQILTDFDLHKDLETNMQNLIIRYSCRNLEIQNELFSINWKLLANVSNLH